MASVNVHRFNEGPAPWVPAALPDEPGDERPNLIPTAALQAPLWVAFEPWESKPTPNSPETLVLYRDGVTPVARREWTEAIAEGDYGIECDASDWGSGSVTLHGVVEMRLIDLTSATLTVTVDQQGPTLAGAPEVPAQVGESLTARYLEAHDDTLLIGIPAYSDPRPGDTVELFWDEQLYDDTLIACWRLAASDLAGPINLPLPGELIREHGDGRRYLHYQVIDRAGNRSADSRMLSLIVAAAPLPRLLPPPAVAQASGSGGAQMLRPQDAVQGVTVTVPAQAVIYPEESLWLQWAVPGAPGAWTSSPIAGSQRWTFDVPVTAIGAHLGKQVQVQYKVRTAEGEKASDLCQLSVQAAPSTLFSLVECAQASRGELSLARVPPAGAQLKLPRWPLISTDQRVSISLRGTDRNGYSRTLPVLQGRAVTATELSTGLADIRVPLTAIAGFALDSALAFEVYVSFDQGNTLPASPNFPVLTLTLRS